MTIRTFMAGDDAAQVGIYNEVAADLPKFKVATLDEVRRRCLAPDFDPSTRLYAVEGGRPVAYVTFQTNGRVSYPWCRKGHEKWAEPLFERALHDLKKRGSALAFAAYRADWTAQRDFFLSHGFAKARDVINLVMDLAEMPTPAARQSSPITPLKKEDLPAILALGPKVLRVPDVAGLERHLLHNRYFPASSGFVLRSRTDGAPVAAGVIIANPAYANPKQLDSAMPCFRLGAFGAEGLTAKRVNGLFSFLAADNRDVNPLALDLLSHAAFQLEETEVETLAAQVPSDAGHLLRFYKQYFRVQGSFPVFERVL
jgi:hypothetical protein